MYAGETSGQPKTTHFSWVNFFALRCGSLPPGYTCYDALAWATLRRSTKRVAPELQYLNIYADRYREIYDDELVAQPHIISVRNSTRALASADVVASYDAQVRFLKEVDAYNIDASDSARKTTARETKSRCEETLHLERRF